MRKLLVILLACLWMTGLGAKEKEVPRIVNFINFIRYIEPRDANITPQVLFETVKAEADAIHQYGFKGTWLLQYDALIDSRYQACMNIEDYRDYCLSLGADVEEKLPFTAFHYASGVLVFYVHGHMFSFFDCDNYGVITLKCQPERIEELKAAIERAQ